MTTDQIDVLSKLFASLTDSIRTLDVYVLALWIVMVLAIYFQALWTSKLARRLGAIEKKDAA